MTEIENKIWDYRSGGIFARMRTLGIKTNKLEGYDLNTSVKQKNHGSLQLPIILRTIGSYASTAKILLKMIPEYFKSRNAAERPIRSQDMMGRIKLYLLENNFEFLHRHTFWYLDMTTVRKLVEECGTACALFVKSTLIFAFSDAVFLPNTLCLPGMYMVSNNTS